jgi:hypothetical protein
MRSEWSTLRQEGRMLVMKVTDDGIGSAPATL